MRLRQRRIDIRQRLADIRERRPACGCACGARASRTKLGQVRGRDIVARPPALTLLLDAQRQHRKRSRSHGASPHQILLALRAGEKRCGSGVRGVENCCATVGSKCSTMRSNSALLRNVG